MNRKHFVIERDTLGCRHPRISNFSRTRIPLNVTLAALGCVRPAGNLASVRNRLITHVDGFKP